MENNQLSSFAFEPPNSSNSRVKIISSERHMRMYDLTENEVSTLSAWNTLSTITFSIGSFFLSQALSIVIGVLPKKEAEKSALETLLCSYGLIGMLMVTVICFVIGFYFLSGKNSLLAVVKNETRPINSAQEGSRRGKTKRVYKKEREAN